MKKYNIFHPYQSVLLIITAFSKQNKGPIYKSCVNTLLNFNKVLDAAVVRKLKAAEKVLNTKMYCATKD